MEIYIYIHYGEQQILHVEREMDGAYSLKSGSWSLRGRKKTHSTLGLHWHVLWNTSADGSGGGDSDNDGCGSGLVFPLMTEAQSCLVSSLKT